MTQIKDISEKKYRQITESSFTPLKFRLEWAQKTKEKKQVIQLFIVKNFDLGVNEYFLLLGIPFNETYLTFTYLCEQPPTFVISDICHLLVNTVQNHGNNSYLINQYLNGNGYKNLEHIVMDIFTQEMAIKMAQFDLTDTAILFNDYTFLIQKSLSVIQSGINSLTLTNENAQNFFFFMLSIEESIKKLNQEFMFLYFCFYKIADESRINKDEWEPIVFELKKSYFLKINHHLNVIKVSLHSQQAINVAGELSNGEMLSSATSYSEISESVSIQLEYLLKNLELFQKKEAFLSLPTFTTSTVGIETDKV